MFDSRQVKSMCKKTSKEHTQSHDTVCANTIVTYMTAKGFVETNTKIITFIFEQGPPVLSKKS